MASIKLNDRALEAYRAHLRRRARLEQRLDDLYEKLDHEDQRIMLEVMDHMGLDEGSWELDGRWFDEFRVALVREGPTWDEDDEDDEDDGGAAERPAPN